MPRLRRESVTRSRWVFDNSSCMHFEIRGWAELVEALVTEQLRGGLAPRTSQVRLFLI